MSSNLTGSTSFTPLISNSAHPMPLPDFLCIGAQKSGTTWLDQVLRSHPRIEMPADKELHFFDRHYDKGVAWYKAHLPEVPKGQEHNCVIGEVTPAYIFKSGVPGRIYETLGPETRFVVILRNPVDRLYSLYKMALMNRRHPVHLQDFMDDNHHAFRRGCYGEQIQRYFEYFPKGNFVFLIYEKMFKDTNAELERLARHLGVDPQGFDTTLGKVQYGSYHYWPRFYRAYRFARNVQRFLSKRGVYAPLRLVKSLGLHRRLFGKSKSFTPISQATREQLMARYADDIVKAEELTGLDLRAWWGS